MARIVFGDGWWLDVTDDADAVRSKIHAAIAPAGPSPSVAPKLITVTPSDGNLPVFINPARVIMVRRMPGEEGSS